MEEDTKDKPDSMDMDLETDTDSNYTVDILRAKQILNIKVNNIKRKLVKS